MQGLAALPSLSAQLAVVLIVGVAGLTTKHSVPLLSVLSGTLLVPEWNSARQNSALVRRSTCLQRT